ncbi:hypothetical protein BSK59_13560 [Paenibacillus odorifer]|uniref:hypothetical protein n=1 Tax=Paenibacillus odorifer TaxID=189426 RepID=UPI00096BD5C8|nr:hypothetical protein [Paenibacillus odorifer]OME55498.1 hypothetical protein BSK59_13560 [Paenibacillus odorifer]
MELDYTVFSNKMAFVHKVPVADKIEKYMTEFVLKEPTFNGIVTVFKDTKYFEDNGDIYQRQLEYEVETGKFRKRRYSNPLKWKVVVENS